MRRLLALLLGLSTLAAPVPALAQWETLSPGGDTVCSDGSPWKFFVQRGDPNKLLLEFEGGGGCWSAATCELDVYTRRVTIDPETARQQGLLVGIYDRANPENPFQDWTHVYIPYCTADLHWGNSATTYEGSAGKFVVQHKGAVNAATALQWASDNVPSPSQVFVAGCSAGGYGAILWSAQIAARWPAARMTHLSDSAAGVVAPGLFATLMTSWNVSSSWPSFIPALNLDTLDRSALTLPKFYDAVLGYYPSAGFSQFNTQSDTTQAFFYGLSKGTVEVGDQAEWTAQMLSNLEQIQANPNFASFLAPGSQHCVINRPELYTTTVNGQRLVDWVKQLIDTGSAGRVR